MGGLQILHGPKPNSSAWLVVIFSETLFTILQDPRWYFLPLGVLYTSCALTVKDKEIRRYSIAAFIKYYLQDCGACMLRIRLGMPLLQKLQR